MRLNPITRAAARTGSAARLAGSATRRAWSSPSPAKASPLRWPPARSRRKPLWAAWSETTSTPRGQLTRGPIARLYRRRAWVNLIAHWALVSPSRTVRLVRRMERLPRSLVTLLSQRVHATG